MKRHKAAQPGRLRIIAGQWRSRVLPVADLPGLRPTADRVRETLFNWLQNDIAGSTCLDLFAGSGALGFEAASRGAAQVWMFEVQSMASQWLQENINTLQAGQITLQRQDALAWLQSLCNESAAQPPSFDVVFVDPPFQSDYLAETCQLLEQAGVLADNACIYLEKPVNEGLPELPSNWALNREKKAGQVSYYLFRRSNESPAEHGA